MKIPFRVKLTLLLPAVLLWCFLVLGPIVSAQALIEHKEYNAGFFTITYPQVHGMIDSEVQDTINTLIQEQVNSFITKTANDVKEGDKYANTNREKQITAIMGYKLYLNNEDILSFSIHTYVYDGGAHGASSTTGYNFNLGTGRKIELQDKIPFDEDGKEAINTNIRKQIADRNIAIFEPFQGVSNQPNFYIKEEKKIVIVFNQYEIAPYSSGILEFEIAY